VSSADVYHDGTAEGTHNQGKKYSGPGYDMDVHAVKAWEEHVILAQTLNHEPACID